jgi:hypothetical protein
MTAPVLQFKRGALTNLPALRAGEPALTTDSYDFYVGIDSTTNNNKFFGSHRYWRKETASRGSGINLVEANTGTDFITLAAPAAVGAAVTYYFPASQGDASTVLTNDGNGNLTWGSGSTNATFTGITTFSDGTDNTLGNPDTGAVQIDGGLGINKNVTVGAGLSVNGTSYFIGTCTFAGGTINIGDSNTDNVVFTADVNSDIIPNTDDTYNLGNGQRWKNANFSGIVTATTFVGALTGTASTATYAVSAGIATYSGTAGVSTSSTTVNTTLTSTNSNFYIPFVTNATSTTGETIRVGAGLSFNPSSNDFTVGGNIQVNGNLIKSSTGATVATLSANDISFADDVTVGGNLYVLGQTAEVETTNLKVEDSLIDLGLVQTGSTLGVPTADLNIDIGVLFNWYNGAAKKAAVYWDDSVGRIGISSDVSETSNVLTSNAYAAVEIGALWVTDCAGTSQVISCAAGERTLNNIIVDAGTF